MIDLEIGKKYITKSGYIVEILSRTYAGMFLGEYVDKSYDKQLYFWRSDGELDFLTSFRFEENIVSEYRDDSKPLPGSAFEKIDDLTTTSSSTCLHGEYVEKLLFTSYHWVCKYCEKDKEKCEKENRDKT